MGKYMRKAKLSGEVAVMEVPHQSTLGVRTRARTLALQRLLKPTDLHQSSPATTKTTSEVNSSSASTDQQCSYIQLRSRRLEKTPLVVLSPRASTKDGHASGISRNSFPVTGLAEENDDTAGVDEVSFGENVLDLETRDRNSRETTPCSLILNTGSIRTPGSTSRRPYSNELPIERSSIRGANTAGLEESRNIPTSREMEEFFSGAEQFQQRIFIEKYNFDPVNDCPLPGRYEWLELKLSM